MKHSKKVIGKENGVALLITVVIVSAVMLMTALIANIVATQLKMASDISSSVSAIYAADSGVEWQLYQIKKGVSVSAPAINGATISTIVTGSAPNFTIKSLGSFRTTKRQFEISF